ncbi:MAG: type II toxin-antitoxin system HicA family toxin [Cyclobacteriaceae bacterium]
MKPQKLIKYLEDQGCVLIKHGARHDMYKKFSFWKLTFVPRHPTINDYTAEAICK